MESELKRFLEERGYKVPNPSDVYDTSEELVVAGVILTIVIVGLILIGLFT